MASSGEPVGTGGDDAHDQHRTIWRIGDHAATRVALDVLNRLLVPAVGLCTDARRNCARNESIGRP